MKKSLTFGLIVGNRGFFPSHLCESGRQHMIEVIEAAGHRVIALTPEDTPYGSVENYHDAQKCANLFKAHADEIDGIIVTLPNFGDERSIAQTIRLSGLRVPVLVQATPDDAGKMGISSRRDSFCGKISVCNNLYQYGIPFSLTALHTVDPKSEAFRQDLERFAQVCRVVGATRNLRIGAIGARPANFNTVRYSEKLLERYGISVDTLDLSEVLGRIGRLADDDPAVTRKLDEITSYVQTRGIPRESLIKMAKFGVVVEQWMNDLELKASAIQCWTAIEEFFGVVPCTLMSMMSNNLLPSACEVDVMGMVSMYLLQAASGTPSAILDWNNNYQGDPNKAVVFHCSNLPKHFFQQAEMHYQEIIAGTVGKENTYGTVYGRIRPEAFTYLRLSSDDTAGKIKAYVGEGRFTDDELKTFGGYGVVEVPRFQSLLQYICKNGFEHHVSVNLSRTAAAIREALETYLGWEVYLHE
ncbi:fucose isomerase [Alicyclobacillus cellulosilyticus]|uniref:Fucose isomerase n=1 Tax=Alicyclobacillus cellulosilyticus TaxID=1003997 RepID=A0A917NHY4_9BACL|nr:L-fucose/L-arabinose isomerase family protein [Alicyclobacillus cellulosilyticus]GGJ02071.1 fucose isomerase [Alicyclobacillus cellulosilyticus]